MATAEKSGQQPADEIDAYFAEARGRAPHEGRSTFIAYVLWFVFGALFAHRIYLGRWRSAAALFLLYLAPLALMFLASYFRPDVLTPGPLDGLYAAGLVDGLYYVTMAAAIVVAIVWLVDLFRMPSMVRQRNSELALRRGTLGVPAKASYQAV